MEWYRVIEKMTKNYVEYIEINHKEIFWNQKLAMVPIWNEHLLELYENSSKASFILLAFNSKWIVISQKMMTKTIFWK